VHDDIAGTDRFASLRQLLSDPSDVSGDRAGLERGAHLALAELASLRVGQRGAEILRLVDDVGIGHSRELVAHLDGDVFKRAVDDGRSHRINAGRRLGFRRDRGMNRHCRAPSVMMILPVESTRAVAPGGTSVVLSVCRMTAGPEKISSSESSPRR
jgi:hypothetical protein